MNYLTQKQCQYWPPKEIFLLQSFLFCVLYLFYHFLLNRRPNVRQLRKFQDDSWTHCYKQRITLQFSGVSLQLQFSIWELNVTTDMYLDSLQYVMLCWFKRIISYLYLYNKFYIYYAACILKEWVEIRCYLLSWHERMHERI